MARSINYSGLKVGGLVPFASALTKGTQENILVKVSANKTVAACSATDPFNGIVRIIDGDDKTASVQVDGFVTMLYDTTAPDLGWCTLAQGAAAKTIKKVSAATGLKMYLVVDVDTSATTVTFLL